MKLLVVLFAATSMCSGAAIPTLKGDNSHYVEGESRYIWMPDGDGVPHLVDLEAQADEAALSGKDGANNIYFLFTRQNPNNPQIIAKDDISSIMNSNYNGNKPLMVIVHGWNSNGNSAINLRLTAEYLEIADANVIVVDWSDVANGAYNSAVRGVPSVGQHLGNFLSWLLQHGGGDWNNVHLVGSSLGAHVVGNAGRTVGGRAGHITGLDPAGPQWFGNSNALNRNDGQYVETIYTDGRRLGVLSGGMSRSRQRGCSNDSNNNNIDTIFICVNMN